jgi:hypothetical protein
VLEGAQAMRHKAKASSSPTQVRTKGRPSAFYAVRLGDRRTKTLGRTAPIGRPDLALNRQPRPFGTARLRTASFASPDRTADRSARASAVRGRPIADDLGRVARSDGRSIGSSLGRPRPPDCGRPRPHRPIGRPIGRQQPRPSDLPRPSPAARLRTTSSASPDRTAHKAAAVSWPSDQPRPSPAARSASADRKDLGRPIGLFPPISVGRPIRLGRTATVHQATITHSSKLHQVPTPALSSNSLHSWAKRQRSKSPLFWVGGHCTCTLY